MSLKAPKSGPSYASRGPAPTRLLPMPLTPTMSPCLRQKKHGAFRDLTPVLASTDHGNGLDIVRARCLFVHTCEGEE